jgi:nucleoside-diphosphate-sugar epimerase
MTYQTYILQTASTPLPWEELRGKRILITGATGLIGGCLVDVLMAHHPIFYEVYASGRNVIRARKKFAPYVHNPQFHFLKYDVTTPLTCHIPFDYIIDAASGASPNIYNSDPVGVMRSNFLGTDHLLDYGVHNELKKFVYVSSGEVYGEGTGTIFHETDSGFVDPTLFRSCYPSSKRASETLCVSYAHQYGIEVSIARPSHIYGPHFTESDNRVYAQFIRNTLHGDDILMKSTGSQYRSWCFVADCASAILFILLKGKNATAYNVADETSNVTIRQLAHTIARLSGRKVIIQNPDEREKAGYTPIKKAVFDTTRLKNLGWKIEGTMEEKLEATLEEEKLTLL